MVQINKLMLSDEEKITDKHCDDVLRVLYDCANEFLYINTPAVVELLKKKGIIYTLIQVRGAISILRYENFARFLPVTNPHQKTELNPNGDDTVIEITYQGFSFINTDTFVGRAERNMIENESKKYIYKTRRWPLVISFMSLGIAIIAYFKPSKDTQILLLPKKEWQSTNQKSDTVYMQGTAYQKANIVDTAKKK